MIVTTAGRTNERMINVAQNIAKNIQAPFVFRKKRSISMLQDALQEDVLVVGKERLEFHSLKTSEPFFFHPNSAMFRIKRIMKGEEDPFQEATQLEKGMSFLDCTLGLASDSIVASFLVGDEGKVIGVEKSALISYLVGQGLNMWETDVKVVNDAMRRIEVVHGDHLAVLTSLPSRSIDVVYFDPMFHETIEESQGIDPLRSLAAYDDLTEAVILEARRVAKKRVVLKDHFRSERFQQFQFAQIKRKTAKFHYGYFEVHE